MGYITFSQPLSYQQSRAQIQNPASKPEEKMEVTREYTEKAQQYMSYLYYRLQRAKEARDAKLPEFNNKAYLNYFEENQKIAHTYLEEPADPSERKMSTGTIESKLNTLLSHLNNLNLTPVVNAFDRDQQTLRELGVAFTDIMEVVAEHDGGDDGGDKEKRMLRQRELLTQGTVFVNEGWVTKYEIKKKLKQAYDGKFMSFSGYTERLEKVYEGCDRQLMYGPNVYLGDITMYNMEDQPFIFTIEKMSYEQARTIYGGFENWKFVKPGVPSNTPTETSSVSSSGNIYDQKWRLTQVSDDQVEIIKYQDKPMDEYMIVINGILMLPPGFPLSAITPRGRYSVAKQILQPINAQFAYGKSFVSSGSVYELSRILDRMLALFELKTRKSVTPPYLNVTNRVIPAKVLMPGKISMGITPNALQPIGTESQGVTASEYQIFKEIQDQIEKSTVSNVFQGQQAKSGATATEVIEVQRQARLTLGLIIAAATLLEVKIGYLRLHNIISNWLNPVGVYSDGTNRYRNATRRTTIEGEGQGERRIIPIDGQLPPPSVVRMLTLKEEQQKRMPVRRMYLSPKIVQEANITWYITVEPKEEETSAYHKVLFREMIGDAMTLMQLGAQINMDGVTDEFGKVYNVDKAKVFSSAGASPAIPQGGSAQEIAGRAAGNRAAGNNINGSGIAKMAEPSAMTM